VAELCVRTVSERGDRRIRFEMLDERSRAGRIGRAEIADQLRERGFGTSELLLLLL
jgi:hypothetical protein